MDHRLEDPDARIRDLAYLLFLEELFDEKGVVLRRVLERLAEELEH